MVEPRFNALRRIAENEQDDFRQLQGLFRRARLVSFDDLTGLANVQLYVGRGETADVDGVLVLGDPDDAVGYSGFDCLLLVPGNIFNGAYIVGLAAGPGVLYDGLGLAPDGEATATDRLGLPSTDGWTASAAPSEPSGALLVTTIEAAVDSLSATTPVIRLAGGGVTADYRATPTLAAREPVANWQTDTLPVAVFRPERDPFRLDKADDFTMTAKADGSGFTSGSWRGFTSTANPAEDYRLVVDRPAPLMRLRGRLARPL